MSTKHGGKRRGAGRPALGRVKLFISVSPDTEAFLREKTRGKKTLGEVIDKAVSLLELIS